MPLYNRLSRKINSFRSFTGLSVEEFNKLYDIVEKQYPESEEKRLDRKDRINAIGQGRDFKLDLKDRVVMLLMHYRLYISYTLLEFIFNLNQSNVFRNIKLLEPLIKKCMPLPQKIHKRTKRISTIEELLELFPDAKILLDSTEQEIPRPKNKKRRKTHYSGKKKRHTVKTQVLVNKKGLIIHNTRHKKGSQHDYDIWKKTRPYIPPDVEAETDSGYQGMQKDFPSLKSRLPIKKHRGEPLAEKDKKHNKELAKERVVVEHTISRIKKFNIIGTKFRNRLKTYDTKMSVACGIVNFKTMLREGMDVSSFVG